MGISHGDFWGHSEGREASCIIIQDLDIFRSGFRSFFCLSELSNSSRKRLEAVGQLLCTDAIRCLYICTARSGSVQSLRFLDSVASVSGNFRKMQCFANAVCKRQTHQQDTDTDSAGLVNWLGDECCIIWSMSLPSSSWNCLS